jgi:hypothetical protein
MFEETRTISNHKERTVQTCFEPWAAMCDLLPGRSIRVIAKSNLEGQLDVVHEDDRITIYAWPGCTLMVFSGDELLLECQNPVPDLPKGMSVRSFFKILRWTE